MDSRHLTVELTPPLATVTLDRPARRNALSLDLMRDLTASLRDVGANEEIAVITHSGVKFTDLTINEIYEPIQIPGKKILWGHNYFFLRDEFQAARPHRFRKKINCVMLAFGGTDQHNMSWSIYKSIKLFCSNQGIYIHIVTGPGYEGYENLLSEVQCDEGVSLTHASGVISGIMEQAQVAITSNGRTVYELAHMNVPSIVIAQHDREFTHSFAGEDNGFISLGLYRKGETEKTALVSLVQLVDDTEYRYKLFQRMRPYRFSSNKQKVVKEIMKCLE